MNATAPRFSPFSAAELASLLWPTPALSLRNFTMYWLAWSLRLGARRLCQLAIADVSQALQEGSVRVVRANCSDGSLGEVRLSSQDRCHLETYLAWRTMCAHHRLQLRTYLDESAIERCEGCHEAVGLRESPLFLSRHHRLLAPRTVRDQFAHLRARIGLNPRLTFSSLAATPRQLVLPQVGGAR